MFFKLYLNGWLNLSIFLLNLNMIVSKFHTKVFSMLCSNIWVYNNVGNPFKFKLIKTLNDMKCALFRTRKNVSIRSSHKWNERKHCKWLLRLILTFICFWQRGFAGCCSQISQYFNWGKQNSEELDRGFFTKTTDFLDIRYTQRKKQIWDLIPVPEKNFG